MKGLDAYLEDANEEGFQMIPQAQAYVRKPTLANAEALLDALHLHVPYRSVPCKRANTSPPRNPLPSKRRRVISVQGGATPLPYSKKIQILSHLDFLHDIHMHGVSLRKSIYEAVLLPLGLNKHQYDLLTKLCKQHQENATFTSKIATFFESIFTKKCKRTVLEKITADVPLHKWVTEWMQQDTLEVVLDGIFVSTRDMKIPSADAVRTVCMLAFFSLLVGKCPSWFQVDGPMPKGSKILKILTGALQLMDHITWKGFIQRFVDEFNAEVEAVRMVLAEVPTTVHQPFDKTIQVTSSEVIVDHTWNVPFERKGAKISGEDCAYVRAFQKRAFTTYSKMELRNVFLAYTTCTKEERDSFAVFLDRMIRVNAMRDMYKADVAIQRGALYLTVDRMAHMYYVLRCEEQKKDPRGLYYFPVTFGETQIVTHEF